MNIASRHSWGHQSIVVRQCPLRQGKGTVHRRVRRCALPSRSSSTSRSLQSHAGGDHREFECPSGNRESWDIVIVGSGVIGLYTAYEILRMGYRVAVIEKHDRLCAGATGAGQGYIWMCHRDPLAVGAWNMAMQSRERWDELLASCKDNYDSVPLFDRNGSLLIANTPDEEAALRARAALLEQHGLHPVYLASRNDVERQEPALKHANLDIKSGIIVHEDGQIDGKLTTQILHDLCMSYGDRFSCIFGNAVEELCMSPSRAPLEVQGVRLENGNIVHSDAVIVCAGAWSGQLLSSWLTDGSRELWKDTIVPRRGHLLVMKTSDTQNAAHRNLRYGIMESSYTKHYSSSPAKQYDITFTATENTINNTLMIGSSRELPNEGQWSQEINKECRDDILDLARLYLPELLKDAKLIETRVGLRPFSLGHRDHRPYIGPVPQTHGLFIAAGHEGSGLTLAPSTADIITHHLEDKGYIRRGAHASTVDTSILSYSNMFD